MLAVLAAGCGGDEPDTAVRFDTPADGDRIAGGVNLGDVGRWHRDRAGRHGPPRQRPYFWDELTAAIAVDESLATFHDARLGITTEGPDAGRITHDNMGADVRVAAAPDVARFESALLAGLNGVPAAMPG